jgi:hypothetical protein
MDNTTRQTTGSTRLEMNISLDEPIPPNALPVSSAARARKNLPRPKMNMSAKKSPIRHIGLGMINTGTSNAAANEDDRTTKGAALNIQDAVSDTTSPLENNFTRLKYGWRMLWPRRILRLFFILEIRPLMSGEAAINITKLDNISSFFIKISA